MKTTRAPVVKPPRELDLARRRGAGHSHESDAGTTSSDAGARRRIGLLAPSGKLNLGDAILFATTLACYRRRLPPVRFVSFTMNHAVREPLHAGKRDTRARRGPARGHGLEPVHRCLRRCLGIPVHAPALDAARACAPRSRRLSQHGRGGDGAAAQPLDDRAYDFARNVRFGAGPGLPLAPCRAGRAPPPARGAGPGVRLPGAGRGRRRAAARWRRRRHQSDPYFHPAYGRVEPHLLRRVERPQARRLEDLWPVLAAADRVVACRYHGAALSLLLRNPVLAVCYERKTADLLAAHGLASDAVPVDDVHGGSLPALLLRLEAEEEDIRTRLDDTVGRDRAAVLAQFETLLRLSGITTTGSRKWRRRSNHS